MASPFLISFWAKFKALGIILLAIGILRVLGLASPEYSGNVTAGPEF